MLVWIKLLHTAIWLFFVACILALPIACIVREFRWAGAGRVRGACVEPVPLPADQPGSSLHGRPDRQFRYLPAGVAGAPEQGDFRNNLRYRRLHCYLAVAGCSKVKCIDARP